MQDLELNNKKTNSEAKNPVDETKHKEFLDIGYKKRLSAFKKKISATLIIVLVFVVLISGIYSHFSNLKKNNDFKIKELSSLITNLKNSTASLDAKINDGKKYNEIWKSTNKQKRSFDGVKPSEINNLFDSTIKKYNASNSSITISVPQTLNGGIYDRKSSDVLLSSINIKFRALDDSSAVALLDELIQNLPGYLVINNLIVSKSKNYDDDDLINISKGNFDVGSVLVSLEMNWYVFKAKNGKNE